MSVETPKAKQKQQKKEEKNTLLQNIDDSQNWVSNSCKPP
jgi:hypothetical protein